ncbi:Rieske (2Fe-2S) protein [Nocardia implantans]|uniref:Cytochrome bc1 complex Rieske iron-sulfur subunit n=1 Tax=Nocardia implantans TaxID=3108168 RepID=A0ABU6AR38_9NOCA|nr:MULTISPECIES: Rieske (2Fe-2S) protein [unclassified Nocardia]MBF6190265.1 Rieske (2Fe-2S) protein [Nocardia beijingensis]MEA3532791.1 Rieske (2Fe-2S) protein [Nocardia sp. CDC192]MEB3509922.1 Rieske (2Fe-2S) protein [Nocardia sp. CDC186]
MKRLEPWLTHDQLRTRRGVVIAGAGIAAAAVTACTASAQDDPAPDATPAAQGDRPADADRPANALAKTADIPVGGGVIVGDIVVTQPSAGTFVGLSSVCTHAGCKVATVSGGTINCACHGSRFTLDGSVARGPASRPLAPRGVRVSGDSVVAD